MSSSPRIDTSVNNPLNNSPRPQREITSPSRNLENPNAPQLPMIEGSMGQLASMQKLLNTQQEEEDEYEPLLYRTDQLVEVKRSHFIPYSELLAEQNKYTKTLQVGGIIGTKPVQLNKSAVLEGRLDNRPLSTHAPAAPSVQTSTINLKKDGIFIEAEEESVSLLNIQRLEQRLLWENKKEWFRKDNGDLIMDSDIYNERMTKMRDVSIARNPNLSIVKRGAYLSERENQKKTQYFKLEILIGKVYITKHPLFNREDEEAVNLKELIKSYKEKADLTLIPHLRKQFDMLSREHEKMANQYPTQELEVIAKEIGIVRDMLEKETTSLQFLMESIYKTWEEIKKIRASNNFTSTTVRLNVRQYTSEEGTKEFELFLSQQDLSQVTDFKGKALPSTERDRRRSIARNKVWIKIFINEVYVGRTKAMNIEWPGFEVNFLEKFQIYLFRKPASIEFQIFMGTISAVKIDTVRIDIPGENANTLTSSSTIYREKTFAKKVYQAPKKKPKTPSKPPAAGGALKEPDLKAPAIKSDKSPDPLIGQRSPLTGPASPTDPKPEDAKQDLELVKSSISGIVYYKAEWFGYGTSLPPPTIDKLGGKKQDGIKVKNYYELALENLVDLNDPRNEHAIQELKRLKNMQIQEVLKRDAMMPFSEVESLRHRLYKLKFQKIELVSRRIPLTEQEIYSNFDFMRLINEYEKEMKELEAEGEYQTGALLKENLLDVDSIPYSQETRKRILRYRKRLSIRQQQVQSEKMQDIGNILSLRHVVNEFYFEEGINPIAEFFKTIFAQSGKLRPKRRVVRKIKADKVEKANILVHVAKGKDVPARAKAASQVKAFRERAMAAPTYGSGYPGGYPGQGFMNYSGGPGFYPPQGGFQGYPGDLNRSGFQNQSFGGGYPPGPYPGGYPGEGYPGGYPGQYPQGGYPGEMGYQGYPDGYQRSPPRSPPRDPLPQNMMPGYPPGYSQRFGPGEYGNNMMGSPNRNEMYDNPALRQTMAGNQDTRMAILGGLPGENILVERVLPFLEIKLYDPDRGTLFTIKTETFEGTYPEWNDNLEVPIKLLTEDLKYDLTKSPQSTRAVLYFTLFDLVSNVSRNRDSTNRYSVLIEKRYLGSFNIPLATLFQNPKQNAVYKIDRPLFLFGYFNMKPVFSSDLQITSILADPFTPTFVNLALNIDPVLELPSRNNADYFSGGENPQLLLNGTNWLKNLKKQRKLATRNIKLWGELINKNAKLESTFIPRFLTPLMPPLETIDESSYTKVARYVSLIPFKKDIPHFNDIPDVWSTCQEFLDIKAGDQEEHAILLCNYFMYIDQHLNKPHMKNYLLLGKAVPEGKTVYVMRRNTDPKGLNDVEIWNACTGDPYFFKRKEMYFGCFGLKLNKSTTLDREMSDLEFPLQEIGSVISNENVWVNIQNEVTPTSVSFDIENKKNWMPFLGEKSLPRYFPMKTIETIQKELKYDKTDTEWVQRLEKRIQNEIAKRIEAERSSVENGKRAYRTRWERRFGDRLRNILLTSFESFKYRTRTTGTKSTMADAQNIAQSKSDIEQIKDDILNEVPDGGDIYGFPLNMTFTDIDRIWQEVKNTDIHNIQSDDIEYTLAVGVYAYDHYILSVWLFVGVIFNKPVKNR